MTTFYLHNWAVLEHADKLGKSAESDLPVPTPSNTRGSLVVRVALSLVAIAVVAGAVGLGSSTLAIQQAPAGPAAVPFPVRPAAIPGHRGPPVYRLPVLPNVDR